MDAAMNVVEMREGRRACAKLPKPAPAAAAREARKAAVKANAQQIQAQRYSPCALGSIAAVVTGLSLSHRDARSLRRCSSSCARVTPWWSRGSTGSPGPCVTYRTVSTTFDNAASPSRRPSDTSTAAGKCFLDMLGVLPSSRPISGASSRWKASGWPRRTAFTGKGRPASIDVARVRELKAQGRGGALTQSPRLSAYTGRASIGC